MRLHLSARRRPAAASLISTRARSSDVVWLLLAEVVGSALGFAVVVRLARVLGPVNFSHAEYASAVAAWLLVLVRGGIEIIVYREAARRPRLIQPLSELLLGLRLLWAVAGFACVVAVALVITPIRGAAVALAGLVLFPSALAMDVGLRARGRFGRLAMAQLARAIVYAVASAALVFDRSHVNRAVLCMVIAEAACALVAACFHLAEHGRCVPRWRLRAAWVFTANGLVASFIRFARVTLYASDLLVLGWLAGAELGPYAAARRIVFALVALGLVVPGALAPIVARAWMADGRGTAKLVSRTSAMVWSLALPAAVGLGLVALRGMPVLFGAEYRSGAVWLIWIAARLPWLLEASMCQAFLMACRHDREALRLVLSMSAAASVAIPVAAGLWGLWGVAAATGCVELFGAILGWSMLRSLGAAPSWWLGKIPAVCGCVVMLVACLAVWKAHIAAVIATGVAAYAVAWWLAQASPINRASWKGGLAWRNH